MVARKLRTVRSKEVIEITRDTKQTAKHERCYGNPRAPTYPSRNESSDDDDVSEFFGPPLHGISRIVRQVGNAVLSVCHYSEQRKANKKGRNGLECRK